MHAVRWEIPSSDLSEQSAIIHRDPERSRKAILDVIKESFAKNTLQQPFHNRFMAHPQPCLGLPLSIILSQKTHDNASFIVPWLNSSVLPSAALYRPLLAMQCVSKVFCTEQNNM
jgi:hypothetical protein